MIVYMVTNREKSIAKILLDARDQLQPLMARARDILALDAIVKQHLPAGLRDNCRVSNFRQGILVLTADNPSWATRLRYANQQLLHDLRQHSRIANLIAIRVHNSTHQENDAPIFINQLKSSSRKPRLSFDNAMLLRQQAEHCSDPALKKILNRLASRAFQR